MEMSKSVQMKLTFSVFILLLVLTFSGVVSAIAVVDEETMAPVVIETGEKFYSPTAIQDAIDDENTVNGYHVQVQPGVYLEQLTINKDLTISGVDTDPQETVIAFDTENGVIVIPTGVCVVLENLSIFTRDQGVSPINNNGQLTLINCMVNGVYYENNVSGSLETLETQTMETMGGGSPEQTFVTESTLIDETGTGTAGLTTTETLVTESNEPTAPTSSTTQDTSIPLASLASGMLMVMGGTVISKRE